MTSPPRSDHPTDTPTYTIGAVGRMVGVPPATLRTWEERYEKVIPYRDASGRRLYSPGQVARLQWIKSRIDEGVRPVDAHRLLDRASTSELPSPAVTPESAAIAVFEWLTTRRSELRPMLEELRKAVGAEVAAVCVNFHHPEFGGATSVVLRTTAAERDGDGAFNRCVGVAWSELPELADPLSRGETHDVKVGELGHWGQNLLKPTGLRSLLCAPLLADGSWWGLVAVGNGSGKGWSDGHRSLVDAARDLLAARYQADRARQLLDKALNRGERVAEAQLSSSAG